MKTTPPRDSFSLSATATALLTGCVLALLPVPRAAAVQWNYTGADAGSWGTAANWTLNGGATHFVPANGDDANLGLALTVSSVSFNNIYSGAGLSSLTLDSPGHASITLNQTTAGTVMIAANEFIGTTVSQNFYNQSAGTNTTGNLYLGSGSGGFGNYALSGSGVLNTTSSFIGFGGSGGGNFSQSGGTHNVAGSLTLGHTGSNPNNAYVMSGGTLAFAPNAGLTVGNAGRGAFLHSAGAATFSGATSVITVGASVSSTGNVYTLSGTGSISGAGRLSVGLSGSGTFTQTGGTINLGSAGNYSGNLAVGDSAGSTGIYNLSATTGTGSVTVDNIYVGNNGTGTFNQNGGSLMTNNSLNISTAVAATGSYNLNAGTLTVQSNSGVGLLGTGSFTQTGGQFVTGGLNVGSGVGNLLANGTYAISGGSLTTASITAGFNTGAVGIISQTGGTVNVTSVGTDTVSLGTNAGGTGSYSMDTTAGASALTTTILRVGDGGTGTFTQNGGTVTAGSALTIGRNGGSTGTYNLNAGNLNSGTNPAPGLVVVGGSGTGKVNQTGGTHTVGGDMQLGQNASGSGTYNLSGGTLNVAANIGVGQAGMGLLNQTGGALTINSALYVGSGGGSTGNYQINAGTASVGTIYNGYFGAGNLSQNGGTLTVGTLDDGSLFSGFTSATGTHSQTGGTLTVTSAFNVGIGDAASSYTLSGTGVLNVPNAPNSGQQMLIGDHGLFTQAGGTVNGYVINGGQYLFHGGTFNGTLDNAAAGIASFDSFVFFGSGLKNHGTLNIGTGGQVGTAAGQSFLNDGTVTLNGSGQIFSSGPIVNNGLLTGTGSLSGTSTFVNNLSITQGPGPLTFSFNPGSAVNNGTVTLAAGRALNLYGGFTNAGTFAVNGASVLQNGTLTNAPGGTVSGPGAILTAFTSSGIVTPAGGTLNISAAWTNNGIAQLGGITDNLAGGAITNTGTIQGFGNVGAPVNNTAGIIESLGGSLSLSGILTNPAGGTLASGAGSKLVVSAGLNTNAGVISLTGGTFDNNNHALTNAGQISGYGVFRTGGAGLTNAGSITFTGGNTTVNGNVTNNAGQMVRISYNPATFTGNVTNNGTFKTTSATSTFAGTFTNNGLFTSDPATQNFDHLVIGPNGSLQGTAGDVFVIHGNLTNASRARSAFDLRSDARISLSAGLHEVTWSAADLGPVAAGFEDNFAVGIFELRAGASMNLHGASSAALPGTEASFETNALYVHELVLGGGLAQLADIQSNGLNIYYAAGMAENAWLASATYSLNGGGKLIPALGVVPEPGSASLLGLSVLALLSRRPRRKESTP